MREGMSESNKRRIFEAVLLRTWKERSRQQSWEAWEPRSKAPPVREAQNQAVSTPPFELLLEEAFSSIEIIEGVQPAQCTAKNHVKNKVS